MTWKGIHICHWLTAVGVTAVTLFGQDDMIRALGDLSSVQVVLFFGGFAVLFIVPTMAFSVPSFFWLERQWSPNSTVPMQLDLRVNPFRRDCPYQSVCFARLVMFAVSALLLVRSIWSGGGALMLSALYLLLGVGFSAGIWFVRKRLPHELKDEQEPAE